MTVIFAFKIITPKAENPKTTTNMLMKSHKNIYVYTSALTRELESTNCSKKNTSGLQCFLSLKMNID